MAEISKPSDINKIWSSSGDTISPSDTKIQTGWVVEIPPRQWFNWLDNKQDQAIAHINQHGIAVWDSNTEYQAGKSYVQGSNGVLYKAIQTNTNQDPTTDVTNTYWANSLSGGLLNVRYFTSSGTYTPTPGTSYVIVEVQGAGGGGGGAPATGASQFGAGGGGGGGGYARKKITSGFSGATLTVGASGSGNSGATGSPGGSTSFGALVSATGGLGGTSAGPSGANFVAEGGDGGTSTSGEININGQVGNRGVTFSSLSYTIGGYGGNSQNGSGGFAATAANGGIGTGYGAGGGGTSNPPSSTAKSGGAGAPGIIIVWEFN